MVASDGPVYDSDLRGLQFVEEAAARGHDDGGDPAGARDRDQDRSRVIPVDHPQRGRHRRVRVRIVGLRFELDVDDAHVALGVDEARGDRVDADPEPADLGCGVSVGELSLLGARRMA